MSEGFLPYFEDFEALANQCTTYDLRRTYREHRDDPVYFDTCANAAYWGYAAGRHYLEEKYGKVRINENLS